VSNESMPTLLQPVSPHNAVLLLVDQQEGLLSRSHDPQQTRDNVVALARCARLLEIPAVMTTALAAGPNGRQLEELTEIFAGQQIIDRTVINAWHDSRVHDAITALAARRSSSLAPVLTSAPNSRLWLPPPKATMPTSSSMPVAASNHSPPSPRSAG
jgi:hypothetical protein